MRIYAKLRIIGNQKEICSLGKRPFPNFSGDYHSGVFKGVFTNQIPKAGKVIQDSQSSNIVIKEYLESENNIETNSKLIQKMAKILIKNKTNLHDKAKALLEWVYVNIKYEIFSPSALDTFRYRVSDCGGKANLLTAFFRSIKIPARTVGGIVYFNSSFGQHYWVEFYDSKNKFWYSADPTLGEYKYINASHFKLFNSYHCGVLIHSISILDKTSIDEKILFKFPAVFNEINKIRYNFYKQGRYIGCNRSLITRKRNKYFIRSNFSTVDSSIDSLLTIDKPALRVDDYEKFDQNGSLVRYNFKDFIEKRMPNSNKVDRIPYDASSRKVFCLDNNNLSHHAFMFSCINFDAQNHNIYNFLLDIFFPTLNKVIKVRLNCLLTKESLKINGKCHTYKKLNFLNDSFYIKDKGILVCLRTGNNVLAKLVHIKRSGYGRR